MFQKMIKKKYNISCAHYVSSHLFHFPDCVFFFLFSATPLLQDNIVITNCKGSVSALTEHVGESCLNSPLLLYSWAMRDGGPSRWAQWNWWHAFGQSARKNPLLERLYYYIVARSSTEIRHAAFTEDYGVEQLRKQKWKWWAINN